MNDEWEIPRSIEFAADKMCHFELITEFVPSICTSINICLNIVSISQYSLVSKSLRSPAGVFRFVSLLRAACLALVIVNMSFKIQSVFYLSDSATGCC
jgi:hypothetical protein